MSCSFLGKKDFLRGSWGNYSRTKETTGITVGEYRNLSQCSLYTAEGRNYVINEICVAFLLNHITNQIYGGPTVKCLYYFLGLPWLTKEWSAFLCHCSPNNITSERKFVYSCCEFASDASFALHTDDVVLVTFLKQEHDKQLFLLEQLQRQKLELEQQKREFEEQQQRQKQVELQVGWVT